MPAVLADLSIEARWIVPMTMPGKVLENHTLVVRDGRILDLAAEFGGGGSATRATVVVRAAGAPVDARHDQRRTRMPPGRCCAVPAPARRLSSSVSSVRNSCATAPLAAIAEMLRSGITCFGDRYYFPDETARVASEQGMRAVIGLPVADTPSPWAQILRRIPDQGARALRDEYKDHPLISTAFAPHAPDLVSDATFARLATLADELDAGIVIDLHAIGRRNRPTPSPVHGVRPIERLWNLGLLTPALNAVHMTPCRPPRTSTSRSAPASRSVCAARRRSRANAGCRRCRRLVRSGMRLGLASGGGACRSQDVWGEMKTAGDCSPLALGCARRGHSRRRRGRSAWTPRSARSSPGKWADLCCIDLGGPATQPLSDPVTQLVLCGGRDLVSDVWVAGRQLLVGTEN